MNEIIPIRDIGPLIHFIRGQKVMLDSDLARIYGVTTKRLNEQVKRNQNRFPPDFMLRLTADEAQSLRSRYATSSWGGRRYAPHAFMEHGAVMLASVLDSPRAVEMSLYVVRAFVRLRAVLSANKALAKRLEGIEKRLAEHQSELGDHAEKIGAVLEAIRQLMEPPENPGPLFDPKPRLGFKPGG